MDMKYIFNKGEKNRPVLLLLHGTGGNEYSLLELAKAIDNRASILSVKGNVDENGMARFFRRLEEGIFDEEDLVFRTRELDGFLDYAAKKYDFNRQNIIGIGYSNGANIAASLILLYPKSLRAAILHHPMVPFREMEKKSLKGISVFISAGDNDPICKPEETEELKEILEELDADVFTHWESNGHRLTSTEVKVAAKWYRETID